MQLDYMAQRSVSIDARDLTLIQRVNACEHPIRLIGSVDRVQEKTGEVTSWSTNLLPKGVTYVACKSRRATRCAPCSRLYQGDAYQLIAAGLRGGKGVEVSVASEPAVFFTLTAPSFGAVHGRRDSGVCRSRRASDNCPHGLPIACFKRHGDDDALAGQPLCSECFDYTGAVLWNAHAGALWRATRIGIDRHLAKKLGLTQPQFASQLNTQYVKVAEFQRRGLVHFHIALRVKCGAALTTVDKAAIQETIEAVVANVSVPGSEGERYRWGAQVDISAISADADETKFTRGKAAGYLAKYATKGSDTSGVLDRRINAGDLDSLRVNPHLRRLATEAWRLGRQRSELRTRLWAHQFGFRGQFCTKSKCWSTTFKALRAQRRQYQERAHQPREVEPSTSLRAQWSYVASGYSTEIEATIAGIIRENRRRIAA